MNKSKAMALIEAAEKTPKYTNVGGFMVSFEVIKGHILASDHFPDKHAGERLFKNEDEAWLMARRFANATDDTYVNIRGRITRYACQRIWRESQNLSFDGLYLR